jgi:hypothetical protein
MRRVTRGLPPPDPLSFCPLSSTEFVEPTPENISGITPPPRKNSWVCHCHILKDLIFLLNIVPTLLMLLLDLLLLLWISSIWGVFVLKLGIVIHLKASVGLKVLRRQAVSLWGEVQERNGTENRWKVDSWNKYNLRRHQNLSGWPWQE